MDPALIFSENVTLETYIGNSFQLSARYIISIIGPLQSNRPNISKMMKYDFIYGARGSRVREGSVFTRRQNWLGSADAASLKLRQNG